MQRPENQVGEQINYADPIDLLFLAIFQNEDLQGYHIANPNVGSAAQQCQNLYINENTEVLDAEGAAMRDCHSIHQSHIEEYFEKKGMELFRGQFHYKMYLCSLKEKADKKEDCYISRVSLRGLWNFDIKLICNF